MSEHSRSDARARLDDAARAARRTTSASRWFSRYVLLMGVLAFALIMAVEVAFPSGAARYYAIAAWAGVLGLLGWWAESHDVHPERAGHHLLIATAIWFGAYLVAVGPFVRWQAADSAVWWSVAAAVMASPFLVVAWSAWRRS